MTKERKVYNYNCKIRLTMYSFAGFRNNRYAKLVLLIMLKITTWQEKYKLQKIKSNYSLQKSAYKFCVVWQNYIWQNIIRDRFSQNLFVVISIPILVNLFLFSRCLAHPLLTIFGKHQST